MSLPNSYEAYIKWIILDNDIFKNSSISENDIDHWVKVNHVWLYEKGLISKVTVRENQYHHPTVHFDLCDYPWMLHQFNHGYEEILTNYIKDS